MKLSKKTTTALCVLATVLIVAIIIAGAYHERPRRGGGGGGGGVAPPPSGDAVLDDLDHGSDGVVPTSATFFEVYDVEEDSDVDGSYGHISESDETIVMQASVSKYVDRLLYLL